MKQLDVYSLS